MDIKNYRVYIFHKEGLGPWRAAAPMVMVGFRVIIHKFINIKYLNLKTITYFTCGKSSGYRYFTLKGQNTKGHKKGSMERC
jgi:hypothetical protein